MGEKDVYSEQEVTEIIRRAIAIQDQGVTDASAFTPGVTRAELERIAAEIGVDPVALAKALSEDRAVHRRRTAFSFKESYERVVDGELNPNDFDIVTSNVKVFNSHRQTGAVQVGRCLTIQAWTGAGQAQIQVASRNGRTKIQVDSSPILPILMTAYPAFIAAAVIGPAISTSNPVVGVAVSAVALIAGIWGSVKLLAKNHGRAEAIADNLANVVKEHLDEESETLAANLSKPTTTLVSGGTEGTSVSAKD